MASFRTFTTLIYNRLALMLCGLFFLFGTMFTFLLPPGLGPDEEVHFISGLIRIENLLSSSEHHCLPLQIGGHFDVAKRVYSHSSSTPIPGNIFLRAMQSTDTGDSCHPRSYSNHIYGSTFSYPGIFAARLTTSPPYQPEKFMRLFYLSRLFQLAMVGMILMYVVRRVINSNAKPIGVLIILALTVTPIFVQQSSAVSTDTIINTFSVFALLFLIFKQLPTQKDIALFVFFGLISAVTKPVLLPIFLGIFVFFFARHRRIINHAIKNESIGTFLFGNPVIQLCLACLLLAMASVSAYLANEASGSVRPLAPADPQLQLAFIFQNLWPVTKLFFATLYSFIDPKFLLDNLAWLNLFTSGSTKSAWRELLELALIIECLAAVSRWKDFKQTPWNFRQALKQGVIWLACAGTVVLYGFAIILAMYLYWTPVGSLKGVEGLQARYFVSVMILGIGFLSGLLPSGETQKSSVSATEATVSAVKNTCLTYMKHFTLFAITVWVTIKGSLLITGTAIAILARYY